MGSPRNATIVLLGPQRLAPTVRDALEPLVGPHDPAAAVTAGWEEREPEHVELGAHLERPVVNLELHGRADDIFRHDPRLIEALRAREDRLRELQALYRLRLRHLAPATRALLLHKGDPDLLEPERESAFESLRALDAHHLRRIQEIEDDFRQQWALADHGALQHHRRELAAALEGTRALLIAGGDVGVLYRRLWLFDVADLLPPAMPIVAWSAGAMALAERIVLFHDSPPQGGGYAELLGPGLGLCPGVVPLPHASERLMLHDPVRVQLLSRRFPDALCVALDANARITWDGDAWSAPETTMRLTLDGSLAAATAQEEGD